VAAAELPFPHGDETAKHTPGAKLLPIEGMGHDLPQEDWPRIVDALRYGGPAHAEVVAGRAANRDQQREGDVRPRPAEALELRFEGGGAAQNPAGESGAVNAVR
jgi:hypothetical protein